MDQEQRTTEVQETQYRDGDTVVSRQTVASDASVRPSTLVKRIVWFIAGTIITLLAIRIILLLLGANNANAFVDFVYAISGVFARPFYGIFSYEPSYGKSVFEISSLVAIAVYALIAWGIGKLAEITNKEA